MLQPFLRKVLFAAMALSASAMLAADLSPASAQSAIAVDGQQTVSRTVKVGLNKSLVIDLPRDARDILVSNPDIADAVIRTPRRIYVTGVKGGQSNVIIFDSAGQQIVSLELEVGEDTANLSALINQLIPGADVDAEFVSGNILLTGSVKNALDARHAEDIADAFLGLKPPPNSVTSQTTGSTTVGGGGLPAAQSNAASTSTTTSGATPQARVVNMLAIEGEEQVQVKVTIAEVQRSLVKQLGIDWNAQNISIGNLALNVAKSLPFAVKGSGYNALSIGGSRTTDVLTHAAGSAEADPLAWSKNTSTYGATIKALEQTGLFRTLAEPTLTAISGENASFLAGGEFPVPTGRDQQGNVTIQFKQYGVALAFTPVVLSEGRISLRVKTEVSELSQEGAVQLSDISIPSLKVRRAETTLELPSGGSMALGGLLQDSARQSIAALPGLGKLPFLGALFRSRDFQRGETELVIIATPYLVKPVPRSALATPDQGLAPASDAQTIFLGNINRVYGVKGSSAPGASYQYTGNFGFIFE